MIDYTIIGEFNYKSKKYELLLDKDNKYFYLDITKGKEEYISLRELVQLTNIFAKNTNILRIEEEKKKKKKRIVPKILIGTLLVTLTLPILSAIQTEIHHNLDYKDTISYTVVEEENKSYTEKEIEKVLEEIKKEKEAFHVEDKLDLGNLVVVYDLKELDDILGYPKEQITYHTIREDVKNNESISAKYKELFYELINNLERQYPNLDLRVWDLNLKTLKVEELDEMAMKIKAISATALACYRKDENTIYTVKDYEYIKGTWDYQVIMHEMCHPIRGGIFTIDGKNIRINFTSQSGQGMIIEEAMNSLLSVRSYDQKERDIAYQLQSNMIEVILECMDNYTLQDFIEHNITYFENELNNQNDNNDAVEMIGLMTLQYDDYYNDRISVEQEQFYRLYDYIARMYYQKYLKENMSYEQALEIRNHLIERITYDVPNEYNIDINHFNEFFDEFCTLIGIKNEKAY